MALAVAHALGRPGKMRLERESYLTVQRIYYPGFTFGGISEPVAAILTVVLLFLLPAGSREFWLTLIALLGLLGMQAVYWIVTHPVNRYWLKTTSLSPSGSRFFETGGTSPPDSTSDDWKYLRNRWESSHLARAGLATLSFVLLLIAVSADRA
jgi:hypothetical protein